MKMWNFIFIFSVARGLDVHDWNDITPKQARLRFGKMPFWDYNETCVSGRTVKFSGENVHFNEKGNEFLAEQVIKSIVGSF